MPPLPIPRPAVAAGSQRAGASSPAAPAAPGRIASDRNGSIDLARGLGALGIAWFHAKLPLADIALAALPMFTVLTIYFGAGRPLGPRARRLLLPWLAWSLVYGALKIANGLWSGQGLGREFEPWMLLTGPALHLWFLPYVFVALVILALARGPLGIVCLVGSAVAASWLCNTAPLEQPLAQWASVWPAAVLGGLMARSRAPGELAAAAAVFYAILLVCEVDRHALILSLGAAAAAIALSVRLPATAVTDWIGHRALGLYLAHPLFIAIVTRLTGPPDLLGFAAVVANSVLLAELIDRASVRTARVGVSIGRRRT